MTHDTTKCKTTVVNLNSLSESQITRVVLDDVKRSVSSFRNPSITPSRSLFRDPSKEDRFPDLDSSDKSPHLSL